MLRDLRATRPDVATHAQKMSDPNNLINGTQVLSQSIYESILQKRLIAGDIIDGEQVESQRTYEEGDTGHVDIMSSFITPQGPREDLEDSQPLLSSPVPTLHQVTQFSESQRFRATPATAGKKRTYDGEIIDTPVPQNPLLRQQQSTPGAGLGLSQVFAATQAASSPLTNGLSNEPRSDRPSPIVELQTRPAAVSSSPLRPISEFKRTATDPATRYVSAKQSQAERERQQRLRMLQNANGGSTSDDEFDKESSLVARKRRQQERELEAREEFKSLSSPILPASNLSLSSPSRPQLRNLDTEESTESLPTLSGLGHISDGHLDAAGLPVGEAEIEHEHIDPRRSGQPIDDENEANRLTSSVLVPKTGARVKPNHRIASMDIDASPSLQRSHRPLPEPEIDQQSSEPFRIMDSQPSQSQTMTTAPPEPPMQPHSDSVDVVEQSSQVMRQQNILPSNEPLSSPMASRQTPKPSSTDKQQTILQAQEHDHPAIETAVSTGVDFTLPEVVAETAEEALESVSASSRSKSTNQHGTHKSSTTYETAPTHTGLDMDDAPSQMSSPVHATPPGRKRRRLLEISAEPSPRKLQSQTSFNADAVLGLDVDQEAANLLETSPHQSVYLGQGSERAAAKPANKSTLFPQLSSSARDHGLCGCNDGLVHGDPQAHHVTPDLSQDIIGPGRNGRLQRLAANKCPEPDALPRSSVANRSSIFDIQVSPVSKSTTQPSPRVSSPIEIADKLRKGRQKAQRKSRVEQRLAVNQVAHQLASKLNQNHEPELGDSDQVDENANQVLSLSDITEQEVIAPEMVFAYYKGDPRGYYPAKVLGGTANGGYQIWWDGYDPEEIDAYGVKALDLRIGDTVKVLAEGFGKVPYIIQSFKDKSIDGHNSITDIRGYRTLALLPKPRKGVFVDKFKSSERSVDIASIYLDTNMWAQLKSRNSVFKPVASSSSSSGLATPIERAATPTTPSSRSRRQMITPLPPPPPLPPATTGIFHNMAFAISYDDNVRKKSIARMIHESGGTLLNDSFLDLLEPGTISLKSHHLNIGFTALLTDGYSRKEKYMQALALGLPCLSGKWIEACSRRNLLVNWQTYLLPAGECLELENCARSRVLPPIDANNATLKDQLSSRPRLFADVQTTVVVGRGKSETKRAPYLFLLQALGAENILTLPDIKSVKDIVSADDSRRPQWIFVDDKDVTALQELLKSGTGGTSKRTSNTSMEQSAESLDENQKQYRVAGNQMIVQSLILGKLYEP